MKSNMNNLHVQICKTDILLGLCISFIVSITLSIPMAIVYLIGVIFSLINFIFSTYSIQKWLITNQVMIIISMFVRIILVSAIVILFKNDIKLIFAYLIGFTSHYVNLICCTISKKGSA